MTDVPLPLPARADRIAARLLPALAEALRAHHGGLHAGAPLERLKDKGLAHAHVRLAGRGLLARVPKQSQLGLPAQANLDYQAACFARASAGGHAPQLIDVIAPSPALPRGALLVEEIVGRPAVLPADLGAIVSALAALHALPLPLPAGRPPLLDAPDPLAALAAEVAAQGAYLDRGDIDAAVVRLIREEQAALARWVAGQDRPPRHLIAFDGHPGNFIIRPDGRAVLVDLEKCRYSYPGLDLAHATLYTSTTWDLDSHAVLAFAEVAAAYAAWSGAVAPALAAAARPWHVPLRRAMWLWSVTWCAKWQALSGAPAARDDDGEDWSAQRSDAALVAHVRGRVDHYLSRPVVERMQAEFDALGTGLA